MAKVLLLVSSLRLNAQGPPPPLPLVAAHFSGAATTIGSGFYRPKSVALDASGNLYIADYLNNRLVKETLSGGVYTQSVLLTGDSFFRVVVDASGNLYTLDNTGASKQVFANGSYTAVAIPTSTLYGPHGLAIDAAGDVYIADSQNNRVIKETPSGSTYTESIVANTGLSDPNDVAVDAAGNVYIADLQNDRILKETLVSGTYTETAVVTGLYHPDGVSVDAQGNLYVAVAGGGTVLMETLSGGSYTESTVLANLQYPAKAITDGHGAIFIAGSDDNTVYKVQPGGVNLGSFAVGTAAPSVALTFTFDAAGSIGAAPSVVTQGITGLDFTNAATGTCNTTTSYAAGDTCTVNVTFNPKAPGLRNGAVTLISDTTSQVIATAYIYGTGVGPLVAFNPPIIRTPSIPLAGSYPDPYSVAVDAAGNVYVADGGACVVNKYTASTQTTDLIAGTGTCGAATGDGGPATSATFSSSNDAIVDGRGNVFVADGTAIRRIDAVTGIVTTIAGGPYGMPVPGPAISSPFGTAAALAFDAAGNLYVADSGESVVVRIDPAGNLSIFAGTGTFGSTGDGGHATSATLKSAIALAFDPAGDLYIGDSGAYNVRRVDAVSGIITTVAGDGNEGATGDGGPATSAEIDAPAGLAVDLLGNLYIADGNQSTIRLVTADGTIHPVAGTSPSTGYTGDGGPAGLALLAYPDGIALDSTGTLYISVAGSGVIRTIGNPGALPDFGNQTAFTASAAEDVSVLNMGNAPLTFSALAGDANFNLNGPDTTCTATGSVAAGASCVLGVEFVPTALGALTGTITLTDNAGAGAPSTQTLTASGAGTAQTATQLAVSGLPGTQPFGVALGSVTADVEDANGNVVLGSTAAVTVTVTGPGGYSQVVTGSAVNGVATLNLSGLPAFTTPGAYTVTTTSAGLTTATSNFTVAPPVAMFPPTSLGSVNVGASTPGTHTFTFTFAAGGMIGPPTVVTQGVMGLDFTDAGTGTCDTNGPSHVYATGDTCTVTVDFNPRVPGLRTGAVVLTDAAHNTLATGYISGIGVGPLVAFNPPIIRTAPLGLASNAVPFGVAIDAGGNVFVSDTNTCVVKKYTASTQTTAVYAGTGSCGSQSGDGGAATSAAFQGTSALAINGRGNLLVADSNKVRSIDAVTGIITTVAGTGSFGTPVQGLATSSPFNNPISIVVDASGNFYLADTDSAVVVKVTPAGNLSFFAGTTIGGSTGDGGPATSALLRNPEALAIDTQGNLYIADVGLYTVRKVDAVTGVISTVAGNGNYGYTGNDGPATQAELYSTEGLAVDLLGNLYISDEEYSIIRVVTADGNIHAYAGVYNGYTGGYTGDGGPATLATLAYPYNIAFDSTGTLYISDPGNHVIRTIGNPGAVPSFGSQPVNNASTASDVSIVNVGNAVLNFTALTPSANFNLNGADTTCTATGTVAVGASCVLGVEFRPTATGPLAGTITLTDNAIVNAVSTQTVTTSGTGTPQTATQLALTGLPTTQVAGVPLGSVTASVEDANGNVVLGSTTSVTVTVTGPGGYVQAVTATAVNGMATLDLSGLPAFTALGTYTVTTTSTGLATATSTFTVTPSATQLAVSAPPASVPAGGTLPNQTVTLQTANNTTATTAPPATITTTVTGPGGYTQTVTTTTVNGVATLNLSTLAAFTTPGTYTETTTSSTGLPPVTGTFTVGSLPATQIAVSGLPTNVAFGGNLGTIMATLENVNGGIATAATAMVTATVTGPGGFSQVVTGTTVNGVATLNLSGLALTTPGTYTVTVASPNLMTSTSTITVAAATGGQAAQLAVAGLPTQVGQGSNLGHISASVETSTGSVVTSSTAPVTLTLTGPGGYTQTVTAAAVNGVAGFDLSSFNFTALGTYTLTVTSPGLPPSSYTFTVAQDFTLTPSGSGGIPAVTVLPGAPATFALTLAPAGTTFNQPITLSATGLPPGATYSFNPPIVTPGASAATSTLTITTAATTAAMRHLSTRGGITGLALAALLLPFGSRRLRRSAKRLSAAGLVAMLITLAGLGALSGCANHGFFGQSPQTYVVTVTATSGSFSHSTTVNLTEQ